MTDTIKHFKNNILLQHCVLSCIKSSSIFQSCEQLKSDTSAAQKKKKKKKKTHIGQVFPICHELQMYVQKDYFMF